MIRVPRTPAPPRAHSRRGATLIELVVSLAIASMVALAAHLVVRDIGAAWSHARAAEPRLLGPAAARREIDALLRAAAPIHGAGPFLGTRTGQHPHEADALEFTVLDAGARHPGPHRVRLWLARPGAVADGGLHVAFTPLGRSRATTDTIALAPGATSLVLRYATRELGQLTWRDEWRSAHQLPLAVRLELRVRDDGAASVLALPLVVPIALAR